MDSHKNIIKAVKSNWILNGGCGLNEVVQTNITNEDIFVKPKLDDILCADRAILLGRPNSSRSETACELQLLVSPPYKVEAFTVLCSVPKIELFIGEQKEYAETVYGTIMEEDEDEADIAGSLVSYRYDVEIEKSGVVEVTLKFITPADEVCVFGIILFAAPNPNGITTQTPNCINLENVQKILNSSKQTISPGAEKCKLFMQLYSQNSNMQDQLVESSNKKTGNDALLATLLDNIVRKNIEEMESRMNTRLNLIEQRLSKLDEVLSILNQNK
ncbi:uncharacterized protein LOC119680396 [Teleopsis dalmanni]|uniref:uncharacterized protein LOC119680396 n=1 Tax=Teleopsis dalmanni TaxID=139649 RepID=UPI0018CF8789|nr:uncharacterized protein LOC119680396 [Teleopsis dalmanni]